jgi:antitoxin component of RelBE/YafQ-DinJ toxin-antitoxin module
MAAKSPLLTFRLDREQRQRLKTRLAGEGRTMSEVVTHGLRQYVQGALARGESSPAASAPPRLPDRVAARLRELRSSGHSELLSATLAALREAGWPLRSLAEALGVSKQAVQRRIHRRVPGEIGGRVSGYEPPPPFPHRRAASANGLRPHLTIKIDHALRSAAHEAAAREGNSLSQVVETILDRYLHHGMADGGQPGSGRARQAGPGKRAGRRSGRALPGKRAGRRSGRALLG